VGPHPLHRQQGCADRADHRPDAPRDELNFTVPGRAEAGSTSPGALRGGTDYLVTVRGTWTDGDGVTADAECTRADWEQTWRRDRSGDYDGDTHDLPVGRFGYDSHTPRLDDVGADPVTDDGDRCDTTTHGYTFRWSPDRTQPLHLRVDDPGRYRDNRGALRVSVRPWSESGSGDTGSGGSTPTPSPTPTPTPGPVTQEELRVDAAGSAGLRTRQSFPKGTALRVTVTGYYAIRARTDWVVADAECTATSADQTWQAVRDDSRLRGHFNGSWTALGDLAVNGRLLSWRPRDGRGDCDEQDHVYTLDLVTDRDGPLSFVVADSDYSDNKGGLDVVVAPR
jgi:hypothetical protein